MNVCFADRHGAVPSIDSDLLLSRLDEEIAPACDSSTNDLSKKLDVGLAARRIMSFGRLTCLIVSF